MFQSELPNSQEVCMNTKKQEIVSQNHWYQESLSLARLDSLKPPRIREVLTLLPSIFNLDCTLLQLFRYRFSQHFDDFNSSMCTHLHFQHYLLTQYWPLASHNESQKAFSGQPISQQFSIDFLRFLMHGWYFRGLVLRCSHQHERTVFSFFQKAVHSDWGNGCTWRAFSWTLKCLGKNFATALASIEAWLQAHLPNDSGHQYAAAGASKTATSLDAVECDAWKVFGCQNNRVWSHEVR